MFSVARLGFVAFALGLCAGAHAAAPSFEIPGTVTAVELYQDHALVTRRVTVGRLTPTQQAYVIAVAGMSIADRLAHLQRLLNEPARTNEEKADIIQAIENQQQGPIEVVVSDLPDELVNESLFVETTDPACTARGVSFKPVQRPQSDTRALDAYLKRVALEIAANQRRAAVLTARKATLDSLEKFVLALPAVPFARRILDVAQLERIMDFLTRQRDEADDEEERLANGLFGLNRSKDDASKARDVLLAKPQSVTVRQAIVRLDKMRTGEVEFLLRYVVTNVSWGPAYKLRVGRANCTLQRMVMIQQGSGEDWFDVNLTLSLEPPLLLASAPVLTPYPQQNLRIELNDKLIRGIDARRQADLKSRTFAGRADPGSVMNPKPFSPLPGTVNPPRRATLDDELHLAGSERQMAEIVVGQDTPDGLGFEPALSTFLAAPLARTVNLSNSCERQVLPLRGDFALNFTTERTAIPVLSAHVYKKIVVENGPRTLPAGPMAVYQHGRLVGQIDVAEVLPRSTFEVGMGVDPTLSTTRELTSRRLDRSGNFALEYRLSVKNVGPNALDVTLQDRLPNVSGYDIAGFRSNTLPVIRNTTTNLVTWPISIGPGQTEVVYSFQLNVR